MQQADSNKPSKFDDELDLRELFDALWQGKWIISSFTAFASIIAVIYSISLANIYESKAILAPVHSSNSISSALGSYSSLAGFAGISLPSSANENDFSKAIKKISSLSFFENSILTNIYLPDLMAFKSWNPKTNKVSYDNSVYDLSSNTWVRDYSYPQQQIPSAQEGFEVFKTKHLTLSEDKKSGFITLSIKHQSPFIAKQWTELVVNEINNFYRQKEKLESEKAVSYLNQQILMTGLSEIKLVLAELLKEATQKLTLIEANQYYVFDYIDPPAVMEKKSEPKRSLICILGLIFGFTISTIFVITRHYFFNNKT